MSILLLAASQRKDSYNRRLIGQVEGWCKANSIAAETLDYSSVLAPLFPDVEVTPGMRLPAEASLFVKELKKHKALILAMPEYNWSVPGHLKNLIDWASCLRPYPFVDKPVLLLSATPSRRGGLLGLTHLQMVLSSLGARVHPQFFSLVQAHDAIDEAGAFRYELLQEELEGLLQRFVEDAAGR